MNPLLERFSLPLSAAVIVPRRGLRGWHVEALKRACAAGFIQLDTIIETPREPRLADYVVGAFAAGERLVRRPRLDACGRPRPILRRCCSPDAAWPGIRCVRWNTNGHGGPAESWSLVINLAGPAYSAGMESSARLGVIDLQIGASGHVDDVLTAICVGRNTIELSATLTGPNGRSEIARSIAAVKENVSVSASIELVPARAAVLLSRGISRVCRQSTPCVTSAAALTATHHLSTYQAAGVAQATVRDYVHAGVERLRSISTRWFLAYRESPEYFVASTPRFCAHGFTPIMPPRGHFYADPCVFATGETDHVFFEDFDEKSSKGVISWMQRLGPGQFSSPEPVLSRPYHLSYPFVFEYRGEIFMVPETYDSGQVELYRAVDFPRRWEQAAVLIDHIEAVDATLVEHQGRWWMFVNVGEAASSTADELYLFMADSPFGPWRPHCGNPVKSDARSARPAGRLFTRGGRLIRPAQNCSVRYGGSLVLNEVLELTPSAYRERVIEEIGPEWLHGNSGCHTLSFSSTLEVIDGSRPILSRGGA